MVVLSVEQRGQLQERDSGSPECREEGKVTREAVVVLRGYGSPECRAEGTVSYKRGYGRRQ